MCLFESLPCLVYNLKKIEILRAKRVTAVGPNLGAEAKHNVIKIIKVSAGGPIFGAEAIIFLWTAFWV